MTKEVMVTISGFQFMDGEEEDTLEMVHPGEYYEQNGTHYILFEEILEGIPHPVKNMVKIKNRSMEVRKKGPVTMNMLFEEGKTMQSAYALPYGSFLLEICTTGVQIQEEQELLLARASYGLHINGGHCADCDVCVKVEPRENFRL